MRELAPAFEESRLNDDRMLGGGYDGGGRASEPEFLLLAPLHLTLGMDAGAGEYILLTNRTPRASGQVDAIVSVIEVRPRVATHHAFSSLEEILNLLISEYNKVLEKSPLHFESSEQTGHVLRCLLAIKIYKKSS